MLSQNSATNFTITVKLEHKFDTRLHGMVFCATGQNVSLGFSDAPIMEIIREVRLSQMYHLEDTLMAARYMLGCGEEFE